MIALLNAYFERLAGAVLAHDGEVLKFIGDGLLAVFPFAAFGDEAQAATASLAAAEAAMAAVDRLNADPPPELARIAGWQPLRFGIALHEGDVFFGNVGAEARLDFTVIGGAVNAASRVEAMTTTLGHSDPDHRARRSPTRSSARATGCTRAARPGRTSATVRPEAMIMFMTLEKFRNSSWLGGMR